MALRTYEEPNESYEEALLPYEDGVIADAGAGTGWELYWEHQRRVIEEDEEAGTLVGI